LPRATPDNITIHDRERWRERGMAGKPGLEIGFERMLFGARWLMAPIYFGLVLALLMLLATFAREIAHYLPLALVMDTESTILAVLTLIDLSLAGNLLLIVLFSGYENFVSKFDIADTADRPGWMGTVDFSGLKMKLIASIVAISGIHLLKFFMEIGKAGAEKPFDPVQLRWLVIIHLTFVASGVLLALMDWLTAQTDKH